MTTVLPTEPRDWRLDAACGQPGMDAELWFPASDVPTLQAVAALRICDDCPVKVECGQWADDHDVTDGTWGGELQAARRARRRRQANPSGTTSGSDRKYQPAATFREAELPVGGVR